MGNDESKLHGTPLEPAWGQNNEDPLSAFENSNNNNNNNNTPHATTGGANINDIPDREELIERFEHAIKNLDDQSEAIPQKSTDDEKWSFIQIQESKNVSNPAIFYIAYLKSILTNHASSKKKFKAKSAKSTEILKDLEIALRTNSTPWLREFLHHPETPGLDLLNEYLGFCLYAVVFGSFTDLFVTKNTKEKLSKKNSNVGGDINNYNDPYNATGNLQSNKNHGKTDDENSDEDELDHATKIDLAVNNFETIKRSHSLPAKRILKNSKILADKEDIHLAIMCFRAICNYKYGFETVMQHKNVVNQLTLALTHHSLKTQARVLDLLGAVAYIKGGHEMCLRGYDYLKQTVGEKRRFTTLTKLIKKGAETNLEQYSDFVVAALKFVNVLVHTVGDMNYRVHLQYEFSCLNYDHILQKLVDKGNDQIKAQVKAYYDNMFDVSVLIGDSEARIAAEDRSNTLENRLYDEQEQRLQQEYSAFKNFGPPPKFGRYRGYWSEIFGQKIDCSKLLFRLALLARFIGQF